MSKHKPTGKGPTYGEFCFAKGGEVFVKGYMRGGKVSKPKVEKVMHEFGSGELHSGSKTGPVVKNRKQAVAIALSEGRKAVKKAKGGMIEAPKMESPVMEKPKKVASIKQSATLKKAQSASAMKRAGMKDPTIPQFAEGGLAKRAEAMSKPKIEGLPPRDMNVKARFVPRMAEGGKVHSDAKQDKAMIKKAIRQHDKNMHGGKTETIALKKGGKLKK